MNKDPLATESLLGFMIPSSPIEGFEGLPQSNESLTQSIEVLTQFNVAIIIYLIVQKIQEKLLEDYNLFVSIDLVK